MWIKTSNELPPLDKWVLGRHNRGTWVDRDDQENVNCVVVKRVYDRYTNDDFDYSYDEFGPDHFSADEIYCWQLIEKEEV